MGRWLARVLYPLVAVTAFLAVARGMMVVGHAVGLDVPLFPLGG